MAVALRMSWLVDFLVGLIPTHFTDGILQHRILLEEVVDRLLTLRVVMHRSLEEEGEETLDAALSCTSSEVAEQTEVE